MSNLDQILDAYGRRVRSSRGDAGDTRNVSVKVPEAVRDEFHSAAKTLGVPRRDLAAAIFEYGMERIRRDLATTDVNAKPNPPDQPAASSPSVRGAASSDQTSVD